jgi:hypothetical protein
MMFQFEELSQLPRKELQLLAKSQGLKANAANSVLIQQLLNKNEYGTTTESARSSTSSVDTADDQFPGLIESVKAELDSKPFVESNKVSLRKSLSTVQSDHVDDDDDEIKASGQWAVSMQKCIGELVKSNSFIACASKLHSASKVQALQQQPPLSSYQVFEPTVIPVVPLSPTKSFISALPVVSLFIFTNHNNYYV